MTLLWGLLAVGHEERLQHWAAPAARGGAGSGSAKAKRGVGYGRAPRVAPLHGIIAPPLPKISWR